MNEKDIKELIGHMVIQMRIAEMELEKKDARIAELEALIKPPKKAK